MAEDNILDKLDIKELSNIIDISKDALSDEMVDDYIRSLINHIAKVVFENRPNKAKDD